MKDGPACDQRAIAARLKKLKVEEVVEVHFFYIFSICLFHLFFFLHLDEIGMPHISL